MSEQQIKEAFAAIDDKHPFYRAVVALLENEVLEEQDSVTMPLLSDGARHFNAGRLARAKDTLNVLVKLKDDAKREAEAAIARAAHRRHD